MYLLTLKQIIVQAICVGIISASLVIAYFEWVSMRNLPEVVVTLENKCIKVINFQNGDAYQCQDVGIVLRKFRTKISE